MDTLVERALPLPVSESDLRNFSGTARRSRKTEGHTDELRPQTIY